MNTLKSLLACLLFYTIPNLSAQDFEWNLGNTSSNPGERIVAVLDAGTIGSFDGVELVGQVIDNNGNWGYNLPTVANFKLFVSFSEGLNYNMVQNVKTDRITLKLRKISDSIVHLNADCPGYHTAMRLIFKQVEGSINVSLGDPNLLDNSGEMLMNEPIYQTLLSGNIGIGTTSPDYELDVVGTIRAQEVKVNMDGADFVFEDNYNLQSLSEVETFIKENKHLPDIAPAKEMQENGVSVGEMNAKLLQKIEELTLHTINQQKLIENQQKEIELLKNR